MPTTERLRQALAELEAQLRDINALDSETQAQLRRAAADINAKLEQQESAAGSASAESASVESEARSSTSEIEGSLRERLVDFEASHPQLAMALTRVIDLLGQAGI